MRGTGYRPDPALLVEAELRRNHIGRLFGAFSREPQFSAVSHEGRLDRVLDQGSSNACVGCALSSALYMAGQGPGRAPIARPSPLAIYANARLADMPGQPLVDFGCRPSSAIRMAQIHGVVDEQRWPFDLGLVDLAPPFDVYQAGEGAQVTAWYRIAPIDDVAGLMRRALEAGHFPVFGTTVDDAFLDWTGSAVYGVEARSGATRGHHMVTAVGFREGAIRVLNSWGEGWGDKGLCWMADEWVNSSHVSDVLVITAAPVGGVR